MQVGIEIAPRSYGALQPFPQQQAEEPRQTGEGAEGGAEPFSARDIVALVPTIKVGWVLPWTDTRLEPPLPVSPRMVEGWLVGS